MRALEIIYTESFRNSLKNTIAEWENELFLSEEKINHFVQVIYQALELLKTFPEMHEGVSEIYNLDQATYRILIGQTYAIFYRVDEKNYKILIGNLFKQKQMNVRF